MKLTGACRQTDHILSQADTLTKKQMILKLKISILIDMNSNKEDNRKKGRLSQTNEDNLEM